MIKKLIKLLFKKQVPFPELEPKQEIEVCKLQKSNDPPIIHFKIQNINEFTDCIGTLCNRHLSYLKVNRKFNSDGSYKDIPVYLSEPQIKITESHRYTSDSSKVTCFHCLNKLKSK